MIFSILIVIVVVVSTSVTVRYTASGDNDDQAYGPTDTRIISVSNALCERVQFNVATSQEGYQVSLYRLNSQPKLTGHETFSLINEQPSFLFDEFKYYYYYMPKGSKVSMSACLLQPNQDIAFYMIKGVSNFERWKDDYGHYIREIQIRQPCGSGNSTYSYTVPSDDFYYLVFDSSKSVSNALNISMYFDRTRYEFDNNTVIDHCSWDTTYFSGYCSLGVPLSGGYTLLQVAPVDDTEIDWKFSVYADIGCRARIWMYFVISLCVLVGVVGILVMFFVFLYCFCVRTKKGTTSTTTANTTVEPKNLTAGSEAPNAPLLHEVPPPTTNPSYPQQDYGTAPPPYKN